jgi:sulfopyruvate decarboxylase TPP-binding subunit
MATWLAYLKSKLLLPEDEDDDFKALEVAEKLKLQLKKLELIRILSDQMLQKKRLGVHIFTRGMKGGIRSINTPVYDVSLYDLLKTYAVIQTQKTFQNISIPKLPVLTTEEEGVALATGAWLGGERSVLLMQSSGVGNCINMFSMIRECRIPFFTVITMRGEKGEFNPWQFPMGRNAEKHLKLCGFEIERVEKSTETQQVIDQMAQQVFMNSSMGAVLLSQQMIGVKTFSDE